MNINLTIFSLLVFFSFERHLPEFSFRHGCQASGQIHRHSSSGLGKYSSSFCPKQVFRNSTRKTICIFVDQNISGALTAMISLLSKYFSESSVEGSDSSASKIDLRTSAIYYFITALFVLLACFDTYFALPINVRVNFDCPQYLQSSWSERWLTQPSVFTEILPLPRVPASEGSGEEEERVQLQSSASVASVQAVCFAVLQRVVRLHGNPDSLPHSSVQHQTVRQGLRRARGLLFRRHVFHDIQRHCPHRQLAGHYVPMGTYWTIYYHENPHDDQTCFIGL